MKFHQSIAILYDTQHAVLLLFRRACRGLEGILIAETQVRGGLQEPMQLPGISLTSPT